MRRAALVLLALLAGVSPAGALRLPIRHFTSADGLSDSDVIRVRVDRLGFVWCATEGGLWRFDGERFEKLGPEWGLPVAEVHDLDFEPDGTLWVATGAGLYRGDPAAPAEPGRAFVRVALDPGGREVPYRVRVAPGAGVYVGTFGSVWRVPGDHAAPAEHLEIASGAEAGLSRVMALALDAHGSLWIATHRLGVWRRRADGAVDHLPNGPGTHFVRDFLFDDHGEVWTAFYGGLARLGRDPFAEPRPAPVLVGDEDHPGYDPTCLLPLEPGRFLVGSTTGLAEVRRDGAGAWRIGEVLSRARGLPTDSIRDVDRDEAGNLWIGLTYRGLAQRIAGGFAGVDEVERPGTGIAGLGLDREGRLAVLGQTGSQRLTLWETGPDGTLRARPLAPPGGPAYTGWGTHQLAAQEPDGAWWVAHGRGLLRYARLDRPPDRVLGTADGLPGPEIQRLFLDSRGDLWVSAGPPREDGASTVARVPAGGDRAEGFPSAEVGSPLRAHGFAEDRSGNVWVGFEDGAVARWNGRRFERIEAGPAGLAYAPFLPGADGRLWLLGDGLRVVPRPGDPKPEVRPVPLPAGFEDEFLSCGVEDSAGRLYLGSSRGLLRLEPSGSAARLFTVADGLVGNTIRLAARDASGVLWFSDLSGLSRLEPGPEPPVRPPAARLRAVRVAGEPVPLPALGSTAPAPLVLPPGRRTLDIDWFAVHHGPGPAPRFQYRLEGLDADWSAPTGERSVLYAGLAPGRYRFQVRAVDSSGVSPTPPAEVVLRVLSPVWRRGWFLGLAALATAAAAYGAYRLRLARLLELERVRTRIATDLHDEIGSTLSQIAVLSQVARRETARAGDPPRSLERITELAGDVVDAMGDTVWAISPRGDTLADLVLRMRRFASDLFADDAVSLTLEFPEGGGGERLDPDLRQAVYLVFKESLHNVRKHAGATRVEVSLLREGSGLALRVRDDGRGFSGHDRPGGHGLGSMRRRAEALGGRLEVRTRPGAGTEVALTFSRGRRNLSEWIGAGPGGRR